MEKQFIVDLSILLILFILLNSRVNCVTPTHFAAIDNFVVEGGGRYIFLCRNAILAADDIQLRRMIDEALTVTRLLSN